jgi:hypothetical protein
MAKKAQNQCPCLGCVHGVGCIAPAMWDDSPPPVNQWAHEREMHAKRLARVRRERERWEGGA